ncbi:MAG: HAD family hydrolase [Brooklawnia sp.]|nr:HAD family hydrolase [Brooklawnia sp.]
MTDAPLRFRTPDWVRGVLFDLDDTLSDYASTRDAAVLQWTSGMAGWELDSAATVARWAKLEVEWFARYANGELTLLQQRAGRVRDFLPGAAGWHDTRAIAEFDRLRSIYEANWRPFPDARDALQRALASGRPVGVLTNGEVSYQARKLRELGLADERVLLLASSELPAAKPDVRAFIAACERLGAAPDQTLMIGDNPLTDVAGGVAAGLLVCHLCRNDQPPASETWVRTLAEIDF